MIYSNQFHLLNGQNAAIFCKDIEKTKREMLQTESKQTDVSWQRDVATLGNAT